VNNTAGGYGGDLSSGPQRLLVRPMCCIAVGVQLAGHATASVSDSRSAAVVNKTHAQTAACFSMNLCLSASLRGLNLLSEFP